MHAGSCLKWIRGRTYFLSGPRVLRLSTPQSRHFPRPLPRVAARYGERFNDVNERKSGEILAVLVRVEARLTEVLARLTVLEKSVTAGDGRTSS